MFQSLSPVPPDASLPSQGTQGEDVESSPAFGAVLPFMRQPSRTAGERGYVGRPPPLATWAVQGWGSAGVPRLVPFPGRGTGGVQKHRGCMCTHAHSHGQLHSRRRVAPKIPCVAWRCACAAVARVARCVHAMAPALRAHAWPRCRVLAGHRERVRVQLRVARVQCVLCKVCAHEQCWQHCAPHGVRHACVLDEAQPMSIIPCVRVRECLRAAL